MKPRNLKPLLVLAAALVIALAWQSSVDGITRAERIRALASVVEIVPMVQSSSGRLTPVGMMGSGTVIDPRGYILTNFHVAGDKATGKAYKYFATLFTRTPDEEPEPRYLSIYVTGNASKDLAIIKCLRDTSGREVSGSLNLPAIPVGDSDGLIPGDTLLILGYPGVSGKTITYTEGKMSGWIGERGGAGKDWIKTDAKIAHGNSGGAALDENGQLVAVPTMRVERSGESQNLLRPIKLASPLIARMTTGVDSTALPEPAGKSSDLMSALTLYIVSADTSRPVTGAVALVLKGKARSGDTIEALIEREGLAWGESDTRGTVHFESIKGRNLRQGGTYYIMVSAKGYAPFVSNFVLDDPEIGTIKLRAR